MLAFRMCQSFAVANDTLPNMGLFIFNKTRDGGMDGLMGLGIAFTDV